MSKYLAKSDELFYETLKAGLEKADERALAQCRVALQAFLNRPRAAVRKQVQALRKVQAFGVSTDFEKLVSDAFNVTVEEANYDLGYQRVFRDVPLASGQDTWDIYDVSNGLTFRKVKEGDRIQVDQLSGSLVTAHVDYYGGALGWTDKMIRYRKIAAMVDMALIFRNRFWSNKADNFYLLLKTAAAMHAISYQGATGDTQLERDIATINYAAFFLANACKDKGYGDTANMRLVMYANPRDKARILAAFTATTAALAAGGLNGEVIQWPIDVIYTFNSSVATGYPILVLPGNKIQAAEDMPPTTFIGEKDPLTLNSVQAVWSIYGAVVADDDQAVKATLG
jgi:hypothetical protein